MVNSHSYAGNRPPGRHHCHAPKTHCFTRRESCSICCSGEAPYVIPRCPICTAVIRRLLRGLQSPNSTVGVICFGHNSAANTRTGINSRKYICTSARHPHPAQLGVIKPGSLLHRRVLCCCTVITTAPPRSIALLSHVRSRGALGTLMGTLALNIFVYGLEVSSS